VNGPRGYITIPPDVFAILPLAGALTRAATTDTEADGGDDA
jgi:hypothetical protein